LSKENYYLSLARDGSDNAVLTWTDDAFERIYYAVVDSLGAVRTTPMVFRTRHRWTDFSQWGSGNGSLPELTLAISKVATPDPVEAGGLLTYSITVQNTGFAAVTGVAISDTVPASTTFVSADSGGALVGNDVCWTSMTLAVGCRLTVQFVVEVDDSVPAGTLLANDEYGVRYTEVPTPLMGTAVSTRVYWTGWLYLPLVVRDYTPAAEPTVEPTVEPTTEPPGVLPTIYDCDGNVTDIAWLHGYFGPVTWTKIPTATAKLSAIHPCCGDCPATIVVHVEDEAGDPVAGVEVVFYWQDAPVLPPALRGCGLDHGVYGPTNEAGDVGFGMGGGAYYWPDQGQVGPHRVCVGGVVSERMDGLGMIAETNHEHLDLAFAVSGGEAESLGDAPYSPFCPWYLEDVEGYGRMWVLRCGP